LAFSPGDLDSSGYPGHFRSIFGKDGFSVKKLLAALVMTGMLCAAMVVTVGCGGDKKTSSPAKEKDEKKEKEKEKT
jgi:hypothetical protein